MSDSSEYSFASMEFIERVHMKNRALVSDGYDESLQVLAEYVEGELTVHEVPSGSDAWTWEIPQKWSVVEAYIAADGEKLIEYDHPLRVVNYSAPVDKRVSREELFEHLHWDSAYEVNGERLPADSDAIPYVFSFYEPEWGFCIRENERELLAGREKFDVYIDTRFEPGTLKVAEYTVEGERDETVLLNAHLDHPGQANDDLSGVAVGLDVLNDLAGRDLTYTYTLLVCPETIGTVAFLSQHEDRIDDLVYGIYLEMLGTDGEYALQHSYEETTDIDRLAVHVLDQQGTQFREGAFRQVIGNDEMVTNGPGVRVPTISLSRWPYDEYHTSADTPEILAQPQLRDAADVVLALVESIERNRVPKRQFTGPLFLSGVGLWEKWGGWGDSRKQFEYVSMCFEGEHTVLDIAEEHDIPFDVVYDLVSDLEAEGLVEYADN